MIQSCACVFIFFRLTSCDIECYFDWGGCIWMNIYSKVDQKCFNKNANRQKSQSKNGWIFFFVLFWPHVFISMMCHWRERDDQCWYVDIQFWRAKRGVALFYLIRMWTKVINTSQLEMHSILTHNVRMYALHNPILLFGIAFQLQHCNSIQFLFTTIAHLLSISAPEFTHACVCNVHVCGGPQSMQRLRIKANVCNNAIMHLPTLFKSLESFEGSIARKSTYTQQNTINTKSKRCSQMLNT